MLRVCLYQSGCMIFDLNVRFEFFFFFFDIKN